MCLCIQWQDKTVFLAENMCFNCSIAVSYAVQTSCSALIISTTRSCRSSERPWRRRLASWRTGRTRWTSSESNSKEKTTSWEGSPRKGSSNSSSHGHPEPAGPEGEGVQTTSSGRAHAMLRRWASERGGLTATTNPVKEIEREGAALWHVALKEGRVPRLTCTILTACFRLRMSLWKRNKPNTVLLLLEQRKWRGGEEDERNEGDDVQTDRKKEKTGHTKTFKGLSSLRSLCLCVKRRPDKLL